MLKKIFLNDQPHAGKEQKNKRSPPNNAKNA